MRAGWGAGRPAADAAGRVDLLACPANESCLGFNLAALPTKRSARCGDGHTEGSALCASCDSLYVRRQSGECERCGAFTPSSAIFIGVVCLVGAVALVMAVCKAWQSTAINHGVMKMREAWPRFKQSFGILVSNYQIVSNVGASMAISFPPEVTNVFAAARDLVMLQALNMPGLSCLFGQNYFKKFFTSMMTPALLIAGITLVGRLHIRRIRSQLPVTPELLAQPAKSAVFKIRRGVIIASLQKTYATASFAIIYLLYPGTSKVVFEIFRCRAVGDGLDLLEADYTIICWTGAHLFWSIVGGFCMLIYPIGIPLYLGRVLWINRECIRNAPGYISIAHYRPLFQFYQPDCFMFEIYFMLEKVALIGIMSTLGRGTLLQGFLNIAVVVFFLLLITRRMPSMTNDFNRGMIFSHVNIMVTYFCGMVLNPSVDLSDGSLTKTHIMVRR